MVHLVYCDNTGKKGEKYQIKFQQEQRQWLCVEQQEEKFPIAEFLRENGFTSWKRQRRDNGNRCCKNSSKLREIV